MNYGVMHIASIAAYILKQGVKPQCLKIYLWHEITSLLGNNLSITSCEPMSVQFHIETRLSLSHPVFPPTQDCNNGNAHLEASETSG